MQSKLRIALVLSSLLSIGCGRSTPNDAAQQAANVDSAAAKSSNIGVSIPGMKPDSMPAGCYLRAVINGKKWEATGMTPDRSHPSIIPVNGQNGGSTIMFVISGMRENVGQPSNLSESNTITYFDGAGKFFGGRSGQVTIQSMDDQFITGTFEFTAEKEGSQVTCTGGEFRIPSPTPSTEN